MKHRPILSFLLLAALFFGTAEIDGGAKDPPHGAHYWAYTNPDDHPIARLESLPGIVEGNRTQNPEGLRAFAQETKELGYSGMMCGRDQAVEIINEVMSPTSEEIARHLEVKEMMEKALSMGKSNTIAAGYDRFLDMAHLKTAYQQLELARKLGLLKE